MFNKENKSRDFFLNLSPGKMSGLRMVSDENGRIRVLALDQSNSFKKFLKKQYVSQNVTKEPGYSDVLDAKMQITNILSPYSTSVLLDVSYGARQSLNMGSISRNAGLIVRLECSKDPGIPSDYEPGWSVAAIKKMGAVAVKLLVYMDCENATMTDNQMNFVRKVSAECREHDILLMTEELSYPREGETKTSKSYLDRKMGNILKSAELIGPHTDILKLEYPGIEGDNECVQLKKLEELDHVCARPWVLLSAGVGYHIFIKQVELAMISGASGVMAGRAIFQEYFNYNTPNEQENFLKTIATERMQEINSFVEKHAQSWRNRYHISSSCMLGKVNPLWYSEHGVSHDSTVSKGDY